MASNDEILEALKMLTYSLEDLIQNSDGVAGLHQNGDIASWNDITLGGRFEGWLMAFDEAKELLEKLENG